MYTMPCSKDLLNSCKIPMGLVIQPYAQVPKKEVRKGVRKLRCNPVLELKPYVELVKYLLKYSVLQVSQLYVLDG